LATALSPLKPLPGLVDDGRLPMDDGGDVANAANRDYQDE
jgi:hypothetical protein